jgi:hypothetical protein
MEATQQTNMLYGRQFPICNRISKRNLIGTSVAQVHWRQAQLRKNFVVPLAVGH